MTSRWCVGSFFELPLSDVTVVDGEKSGPRAPRSGRACRRSHVVRRHVVHGARSARRHRLLLPGCRGERCLAAAHARPLIRPEDALRQAVCAAGIFRSVRRDAIQRDALLARPDVERRSGDRGPRHRAVPSTCHRRDAHRAGQAADGRRPTTISASASEVTRSVRPTAIRSFSRPTSRSADS